MTTKRINELLDKRDSLLKTNDKSPEINKIQFLITQLFKVAFDKYPVDFIIETLTRFGDAPNVLYDDNGLFAVTSDGFQPVVMGKERIEGNFTCFVEKKQWKKTIRLALKHYMKIK